MSVTVYCYVGYCININQISKSDVVNLVKNADMAMQKGALRK